MWTDPKNADVQIANGEEKYVPKNQSYSTEGYAVVTCYSLDGVWIRSQAKFLENDQDSQT